MAFTIDAQANGVASGVALTVASTAKLVIATGVTRKASGVAGFSGVQFGGVTMTALTKQTNSTVTAQIWYLVDPPTGAQTLTWTAADAGAHAAVASFTVAANMTAAFDTEAGTTGTTTTPTQAITPGAQPNVIIAVATHEGANASTGAGTGQIGLYGTVGTPVLHVDEGVWNSSASREATTSTASDTQSFTNAASDLWAIAVATFKEVAPPPQSVTAPLINQAGATFAPTFEVSDPADTSYTTLVKGDTPIHYYRLEQTSGAVYQDASGSNDGSIPATGITLGVTGQDGNAASFSGSTGAGVILTGFEGVAGDCSIEAWIKLDTLTPIVSSSGAHIIADNSWAGGGTGTGFQLIVCGVGWTVGGGGVEKRPLFRTGDRNTAGVSGTSDLVIDTWYHIVGVASGTDILIYLNGSWQATLTGQTAPAVRSGVPVRIGANNQANRWLVGDVDEVVFYNYALSAADILAHYEAIAGAGAQNVSPGLINQAGAIFAPTLLNPQTVTASLIDQTGATFAPEVTTPGAQNVSPGLINQSGALFAPQLNQQVSPDLIGAFFGGYGQGYAGDGYAIFAPTFLNPQTVTAGLISRTGATFAPTVNQAGGAQNVSPSLISQTGSTFAPVALQAQIVTVGLIATFDGYVDEFGPIYGAGSLIFAPVIPFPQSVSPSLISQPGTTFAPVLLNPQTVTVGLISQTGQTFAPTVNQGQSVSPGLIDQTGAAFTPTVLNPQTVTVGLISQQGQLFTPVLNQAGGVQSVSPPLLSYGQVFTPEIRRAGIVNPSLISSTGTIFAPTVSIPPSQSVQVTRIDRTGTTFAPTVSIPASQQVTIPLISRAGTLFEPAILPAQLVQAPRISSTGTPFAPLIAIGVFGEPVDPALALDLAAVGAATGEVSEGRATFVVTEGHAT